MSEWQACRIINDDGNPMDREELIDHFITLIDRGFEETGSYDFYWVCLTENGEDLSVALTGNGPRSEKHAVEIAAIPDAINRIAELEAENERLREALKLAKGEIESAVEWRQRCHEHDADMGNEPREFLDDEEWDSLAQWGKHSLELIEQALQGEGESHE